MRHSFAVLAVGFFAAVGIADIGPPPGFKRVAVIHKITTDKELADYSFFTVVEGLKEITAVKIDPKTPIEVNRPGLLATTELVAVPKDAAKKYGSEKEFHAAILAGKVEGQAKSKTTFFCRGTAKINVKGDSITIEYKLDKIDAKEGLVLTKQTKDKDGLIDDADAPEGFPGLDFNPGFNANSPDQPPHIVTDAPIPTSTSPALPARGGVWVAGIASAAAVVLAGLWLVGRSRRR